MLTIFQPITTFVFDVDGVLTDGSLFLLPDGEMVRRMNIKDGYAIQLAIKQGYTIIIISGAVSAPVKLRLERLGVQHIYMGIHDKKEAMLKLLEELGRTQQETLFMGDDMPDLEAMEAAGVACCPADACAEIKKISHYISPKPGGMGCARDVIEKVMKLQDKWYLHPGVTSR